MKLVGTTYAYVSYTCRTRVVRVSYTGRTRIVHALYTCDKRVSCGERSPTTAVTGRTVRRVNGLRVQSGRDAHTL